MLIITTPNIEGKKIVRYFGQMGQGGGMLMVSANGTAVAYEELKES